MEIQSRQAVAIAAGKKVIQQQDWGRARVDVVNLPTTHLALVATDTIATHILIPAGSRLLPYSFISGAGTFDIGLRDFNTGVVIDATAIAAASGAGFANNGTKLVTGIDYVTTVEAEVFITAQGAVAANAPVAFYLAYLGA